MKKRTIIIVIIVIVIIITGVFIWIKTGTGQNKATQIKQPSDEEKILTLSKQDPAAQEYGITASSAVIKEREQNWYVAAVTYLYSNSNTYATYPSILLRDNDGDFSIVVGFNDFTDINQLINNKIPPSIATTAMNLLPDHSVPEDIES